MYELKAIASFDHHGSRRAGDKFKVGSKRHADDLVSKGLVELIGEERVLALESNNETHRYTREELDGIRAKARADLRALKQREAA